MATAPLPLAREHPDLEPKEPINGPRNDRLGDELLGRPLLVSRIVEAECREVGMMADSVDVRRELSGPPRISADQWVEDEDLDVGISEVPPIELPSFDVADANPVGLHYRAERPLPNADPARAHQGLEARIELPQATALALHRKGDNHHRSPKKVLRGVDRAALGVVDAAPKAGMRPMPGTWRLRPCTRSISCCP